MEKKPKLTTDNNIDFYSCEMWGQDFGELKDIVDNGTTEITVETPEGWKCERPNCPMDYLHKHGTYPSLATNSNK